MRVLEGKEEVSACMFVNDYGRRVRRRDEKRAAATFQMSSPRPREHSTSRDGLQMAEAQPCRPDIHEMPLSRMGGELWTNHVDDHYLSIIIASISRPWIAADLAWTLIPDACHFRSASTAERGGSCPVVS